MTATLEHASGSTPVMLRNLSATGALIEGDKPLTTGSSVVFRKNDLAVSGHVAWVDGRRAGIAFDMSLDPESVKRHVAVPGKRREESHKRPGFRGPMSLEERRLAEILYGRPLPTITK